MALMSEQRKHTLTQRLILQVGAPLLAMALRLLAWTWRTQVIAPPEALPKAGLGPNVYAMWHDGLLAIVGHWRDHAIQGLASQSFDGEVISQAMSYLGYPMLSRGSSSRGGMEAMRMQLEALRAGRHIVVTMDGPRGPRHECKAGTVLMAARSGRPLIPVLCAAKGAFKMRNWDRTLLPLPFAKLVFVLGQPIAVPEQAAGYKQVLEGLSGIMDALEAQAGAALQDT